MRQSQAKIPLLAPWKRGHLSSFLEENPVTFIAWEILSRLKKYQAWASCMYNEYWLQLFWYQGSFLLQFHGANPWWYPHLTPALFICLHTVIAYYVIITAKQWPTVWRLSTAFRDSLHFCLCWRGRGLPSSCAHHTHPSSPSAICSSSRLVSPASHQFINMPYIYSGT